MDDLRYGTVAGFAAAAEEAHRRRTSSARAAALAVAVVVAMGGTSGLVGRSTSFDRIEPAVPTAEPVPSPDGATPAPSAPVTVAAPGGPGLVDGAAPRTSPAPPPSQEPAAGAAGPGRAAGPQSQPARRAPQSSVIPCLISASGECLSVSAPAKAGRGYDLKAVYCAGPERRRLGFADDVEVEFRVTGWHRVLWTSLADHPPRPQAHAFEVQATQCVSWTVRWNATTNDGTPLPKARYHLYATVRSPDVRSPQPSTEFTIG